jgi:hypothetical protein
MNQIEENSRILIFKGRRLEPASIEKNMVGFCRLCGTELMSVAYHSTASGWLVSACCPNGHLALMCYDLEWKWLEDAELETIEDAGPARDEPGNDKVDISSISKDMLEAVFTQAEIRDMLACQQGRPYTRQNLYRARTKYDKFEKLFGMKIDV